MNLATNGRYNTRTGAGERAMIRSRTEFVLRPQVAPFQPILSEIELKCPLGKQFLHDVAVNVSEANVAATEMKRKSFMVDTQ